LVLVFRSSDSTCHVIPLSELKTAPSVSPDDILQDDVVSKQVMVSGQAMMGATEEEILFGESSDDDEAEEKDDVSKGDAPKDIVTKDVVTQEDVTTQKDVAATMHFVGTNVDAAKGDGAASATMYLYISSRRKRILF
jgi:hypothetical protein